MRPWQEAADRLTRMNSYAELNPISDNTHAWLARLTVAAARLSMLADHMPEI